MSGHSKWSKVKFRKAVTDARKGKIFSKVAKMIAIAAREGSDPEFNSQLRLAIEKAKSVNMPNANIKRAVEKGSGKGTEGKLEEISYEAYGPGGVALIIETVTDNKNRSLAQIKHTLSVHKGKIGEKGSVEWMFEKKGVLTVEKQESRIKNQEELELLIIDAGAEDLKSDNNALEIYTKPGDLDKVRKNLEARGVKIKSASLDWIPKNPIEVENPQTKAQLKKLFEALDENEDVSEIYSNITSINS